MDHIIIEGFIGSGKGAVARGVGKKLELPVVDVDRRVADRLKMTTAEIYDRFGEPYYRAMETLILSELLDAKKRCVIVLGSGVAMMPQNAEYLKELGTVYYIKLKQQTILDNMRTSSKHDWIRPDGWDEQVTRICKEREPAYKKTANVTINAEGKTTEKLVDKIAAEDKKRHAEPEED